MKLELERKERDLLITELEETTIPHLREMIASGLRKESRDELKEDEVAFKHVLEKLRLAA